MKQRRRRSRAPARHKKAGWLAALGLAAAVGFIGGLYARTQTSVTNRIETGIVDIRLQEYQFSEGKEVLWQGIPTILPGMEVSKIPRITNDGNDCYVRAKLTFLGTDQKEELEEGIYGQSKQWVRAKDGYYYYTEVLPSGENVDLFEGLRIPEDLPQEEAGQSFQLRITVDAIQSANLQPDYEGEAPWGDVEIVDCEKEGLYDLAFLKQAEQEKFAVVYEGRAAQLFTEGTDFFWNFPALLPGDTYTDTAILKNTSNKPVKLYFHAKALEDSSLLDELRLTILLSGENGPPVYQGPLRGTKISEEFLLTTIPAGESRELAFTLDVPAGLNNEHSISKALVQWVFAADPESVYGVGGVKTGDPGVGAVLLSGAAAALLLVSLASDRAARRRRKRRQLHSERTDVGNPPW